MIVAFLGLGKMGSRMAANLAEAGHDMRLYNRTTDKAEMAAAAMTHARVAATPAEAAAEAEVVVSMLADETSVRQVYAGVQGVLAGLRSGTVAIDMGTTGPNGVAWLEEQVRAVGGVLVDAPVSGSTAAAEVAELTILAGGDQSAVARVEPLLVTMGSKVYHLGPTGSGAAMKLAVNAVIYALGQGVSEALVLAERAGIERSLAYDVFEHSAVAAPMVHYRRDAFVHPDDTPPAFAMVLAEKDLELITRLAAEVGAAMPQAVTNLEAAGRAIAAGFGDDDLAAVAQYLRRLPEEAP